MITLERVTKQYANGHVAPRALDLTIVDGEITVLIGPSGCGKTTTLRLINRLVEPTSGRVLLDGTDIATLDPVALRRGIGYVIQQIGLFPHLTIGENVATIPKLLGWSKQRQAQRVGELLELVGLEPAQYRDRYPHQLSGGQQQRVGVARALGGDPPVLLMDEPFGALDPISRAHLQDELLAIQAGVRKTIVFVTHDIDEAVKVGDQIVVLAPDGTLAQHGTARDLLAHPGEGFVTSFLGSSRALLLLAVTTIDESMLVTTVDGEAGALPRIALGTPARDAIAAMVLAGSDAVAVTATDGSHVLGVLRADALARLRD